jgi:hypothetical protein
LIGAKGEDPPKMLSHFGRAVNIQGSLFNVLREIAVSGDPAGVQPRRLHNRPAESEAFRGNQQRVPPPTLSFSKHNKLYENSLIRKQKKLQYHCSLLFEFPSKYN